MSFLLEIVRKNLPLSSPEAEELSSVILLRFLGLSREERSGFSALRSVVGRDRLDPLRP